ncbi:MAG: Rrf2 family transcriptional regulator [Terriglobales bacterium]
MSIADALGEHHTARCDWSLTNSSGKAFTDLSNRMNKVRIGLIGSMQINRATDYAIRATIYLATVPALAKVPGPVLASVTEAPESFVSKVLQKLVQARLVSSQRGMGGGFQLARRASDISLLEVVEAVEGPTQLNLCVPQGSNCARKDWCGAHPVWLQAQEALVNVLGRVSIAQLARDSVSRMAKLHRVLPAEEIGKRPSGKRRVRRD